MEDEHTDQTYFDRLTGSPEVVLLNPGARLTDPITPRVIRLPHTEAANTAATALANRRIALQCAAQITRPNDHVVVILEVAAAFQAYLDGDAA